MARGEHHKLHAQDRTQRHRALVAQEAARLMSEHGIRDFHHAKVKAAERLGIADAQALPRNNEIEDALREHQRIFKADSQPQALRARREAAVEAIRFLRGFDARLVGAVLEGTADEHSAVCLHIFSDDPEAPVLYLQEQGIPLETQTRRLRWPGNEQTDHPVLLFGADGIAFDLTVLPLDALRQAPLDRVDERPMRRATASMVQALLAEEDIAAFNASALAR